MDDMQRGVRVCERESTKAYLASRRKGRRHKMGYWQAPPPYSSPAPKNAALFKPSALFNTRLTQHAAYSTPQCSMPPPYSTPCHIQQPRLFRGGTRGRRGWYTRPLLHTMQHIASCWAEVRVGGKVREPEAGRGQGNINPRWNFHALDRPGEPEVRRAQEMVRKRRGAGDGAEGAGDCAHKRWEGITLSP